jgi:SAM-dependent methyltransferase
MTRRISIAAGLIAALAVSYFAINRVNGQSELASIFNGIYREGQLGQGRRRQGSQRLGIDSGHHPRISFLPGRVHQTHGVTSIVDAGCGDWNFSSAIDWGGASYLGVDIASDVIDAVRRKHETGKIRFQVGDVTDELPEADLLISKDVLQHLPNALVQKFIKNNLKKGKYKWVLLTNDRGSGNVDTVPGGYRAIDLAAPPFDVNGLVDLPIRFGSEVTKVTSLLDLSQER